MGFNGYKDLIIYKESDKLVLLVYKYSTNFPKSEIFGLTS